ncbi:MAG: hypothetical protein ACE14L_14165 [Terriglobales bacterium]
MASNSDLINGGTVYNGPSVPVENLWGGNRRGTGDAPKTETVFDETTFVARKTDNSVAVAATRKKARAMSLRFFLVAVISGVEAALFAGYELLPLAAAAVLVALFFTVLGMFAFRMSKNAFLAGALVYAGDTLFLLTMWSPMVLYAIIVHCIIAWRLYCMYGLIRELEYD